MSNQKIADSRVLRNSLTSLSPFPFKACSERIIDFHFLSAHRAKFSGKKFWPPFYFAGLDASRWDWELVKQRTSKPSSRLVRDHVRATTDQGHTSLVKYAKRRRLSQGY